jgi:hypothetical protein
MAKATKVLKRPCSERRIQANRLNSKRSTGPSPDGCKRSSQNNLQHGMRSKQLLIPGESQTELDTLKSRLFATIDPQDPVEEMLANRVFEREWYRRRGIRAATDRTSEAIEAIFHQAGACADRELDRLAPLVEAGDRDALRQLRSFPAGVAHLRNQWTILQSRLFQDRNLLGTQRLRCFTLAGTVPENALRDDPVATKVLRIQIGIMLSPEADLADVASFLGEQPPEWMEQEEFDIRVTHMRASLKPRKESFLELMDYVAEAIAELQAHALKTQETAARRLEQQAGGAAVDSSPEGIRLMGYITSNEKGCDAALRRLELGRKPDRPGPKGGPKKPVAAPAAASPMPESSPEPADVAADVHDTVGAEVPAEDAATVTTTQGTETQEQAGNDFPESEQARVTGADFSTLQAIEEPAQGEAGTDFSTLEAIEEPAPAEAGADFSTLEAIEEPAPAEAGADFSTLEAIEDSTGSPLAGASGGCAPVDEAELERDLPEFARFRTLHRQVEADLAARCGREDEPAPGKPTDREREETPLSRAMEHLRLRQMEQSRQLDAHFGINGERPEAGGENPVSGGVFVSDGPERGDSS